VVEDLIASARAQAETSAPDVRAAALLRIARVETAFDHERARRTLKQGLEEARRLPGPDGMFLLDNARILAAAVAPDLMPDSPGREHGPRDWLVEAIGRTMLDHGYIDEAVAYLLRSEGPSFPFGLASNLMQRVDDEAVRLAILRRAVAAWIGGSEHPFHPYGFLWLFRAHSNLLPVDEARETAHAVVRAIVERKDLPVSATFDAEDSVEITSGRANDLFQIFDVVRRLDPPLADSLVADHEQLAAAVRRFPAGLQSVEEKARQRAATQKPAPGGGFIMGGSRRDFPYMMALMQASRDGEFDRPLEEALVRYREDTAADAPNRSMREFWPSTCLFREVLYAAGKRLGEGAAALLDRIPDRDARLFAEIEFAGALAGLPELRGMRREFRPPPRAAVKEAEPVTGAGESTGRGTGGPRIRCPKCNWSPTADSRWSCKCGHVWNTFDTGGVCPGCLYQWKVTACLQCGQWSAHSDWYTQE
jgi:hypothetical protein